jgi:hypothetical protein
MKTPLSPFRSTLAAAALAAAGLAQNPEVRDMSTPTGSILVTGVSSAYVQNNVINAGYRIVDLEIDPALANPFTVAAVHNSGAYASGWWWYYGLSFAEVGQKLSANQARLIDLERYVDNGVERFACVMVPNTGNNAKSWWYYAGISLGQVMTFLSNNGARPIDLDTYVVNGVRYYSIVMIKNVGIDQRTWWVYSGLTLQQAYTNAIGDGARILDIEDHGGTGACTVVYDKPVNDKWWYYYNLTLEQLGALLAQNGARAIDVERVVVSGQTRFHVAMMDNVNALTSRIGSILRNGTDASTGCYLKQIGGSVRADLQGGFVFEPASTLKTLYHAHAMKRVQLGLLSLGANWSVATSYTGSCPTGGAPFVNEPVETTLKLMMENSDNARTRKIADFYGYAALNGTATALGMAKTSVNHVIGCGGPTPNELTLHDIGKLHEQVAGGYLGAQRQKFYDLMVNGTGGWPTWGALRLSNVIDQEAANLGIPPAMVATFKSNTDVACKAGSYGVGGKFYYSIGGFIALPFVANGLIVQKEYVAGTFAHGGSNEAALQVALGNATAELLRDEVRAALLTWDDVVFGSFAKFGAGCLGSNGTPVHDGTGNPTIGNTITMTLANGPAGMPGVLYVGDSKTAWDRIPLPLHLAGFGATGCYLRVSPLIPHSAAISRGGTAGVPLGIPSSKSLVGLVLHSQFWCVDPAANQLGLTFSNGVTTLIGGQK